MLGVNLMFKNFFIIAFLTISLCGLSLPLPASAQQSVSPITQEILTRPKTSHNKAKSRFELELLPVLKKGVIHKATLALSYIKKTPSFKNSLWFDLDGTHAILVSGEHRPSQDGTLPVYIFRYSTPCSQHLKNKTGFHCLSQP